MWLIPKSMSCISSIMIVSAASWAAVANIWQWTQKLTRMCFMSWTFSGILQILRLSRGKDFDKLYEILCHAQQMILEMITLLNNRQETVLMRCWTTPSILHFDCGSQWISVLDSLVELQMCNGMRILLWANSLTTTFQKKRNGQVRFTVETFGWMKGSLRQACSVAEASRLNSPINWHIIYFSIEKIRSWWSTL